MRVEARNGKVQIGPDWTEIKPEEVFFAADALIGGGHRDEDDFFLPADRGFFEESVAVRLSYVQVTQLIDRLTEARRDLRRETYAQERGL